jgi:hypothetical protein
VVSAQFTAKLDERLGDTHLNGQVANVVASAKSRPLAGGDEAKRLSGSTRATVGTAIESSSRDAFRLAVGIGACLMFAGGITSALGIQNPRRHAAPTPVPRAVPAGECGRAPGFRDAEPVPGALEPAPGPAEAPL